MGIGFNRNQLTDMKRRNLLKLAIGCLPIPAFAVKSMRCDADMIEKRIANGEWIDGEKFIVRRTVRVDVNKKVGFSNCHFNSPNLDKYTPIIVMNCNKSKLVSFS